MILDTSAYSALFKGVPAVLEIVRSSAEIVLTPIVLGELRAGFLQGTRAEENEQQLAEFLQRARVRVVPIDTATSLHYAEIKKELRDAGTPIPANDLWIAASALQHRLAVLTLDQHFESVARLEVHNLAVRT